MLQNCMTFKNCAPQPPERRGSSPLRSEEGARKRGRRTARKWQKKMMKMPIKG